MAGLLSLAGCAQEYDVAFLSDRGSGSQIWRVRADSALEQVTFEEGGMFGARFRSDMILYSTVRDGRAQTRHTDPVWWQSRRTNSPGRHEEETPDFNGSDWVYRVATGIVIIDGGLRGMSASEGRWLVEDSTATQPVFSPDGSRVAYTSARTGNRDIWVVDVSTGETRPWTTHPAMEGHPAWHPNGRELIYYRYEDGNADLFSKRGPEGAPRQLTDTPENELVGRWSPDGRQIAFGGVRDGDWEVFTMQADGTGLQRVTRLEGFDGDPIWLPRAQRPDTSDVPGPAPN
ncbi:MAG: PD40 domain-containing protein [Rhodothermales bacterium]|nr:PD40 domain-containing protein [Rhodothermales bacterium]